MWKPAIYISYGLRVLGEATELDKQVANKPALLFRSLLIDGSMADWPVAKTELLVFDTILQRDKANEELKELENVESN